MNDTSSRSPRDVSIEITLEGRGSFSGSGPDDLVFKALSAFRDEVAGTATSRSAAPQVQRTADTRNTEVRKDPVPSTSKSKDIGPLAPYMKLKAPKTNPEAVAVMTVWDHLKVGTSEWSVDSIAALWRNSSRPKAGNLSRDIDLAVKAGWLDRPERGKYEWNQFGQDYVEGDLPYGQK